MRKAPGTGTTSLHASALMPCASIISVCSAVVALESSVDRLWSVFTVPTLNSYPVHRVQIVVMPESTSKTPKQLPVSKLSTRSRHPPSLLAVQVALSKQQLHALSPMSRHCAAVWRFALPAAVGQMLPLPWPLAQRGLSKPLVPLAPPPPPHSPQGLEPEWPKSTLSSCQSYLAASALASAYHEGTRKLLWLPNMSSCACCNHYKLLGVAQRSSSFVCHERVHVQPCVLCTVLKSPLQRLEHNSMPVAGNASYVWKTVRGMEHTHLMRTLGTLEPFFW